jgi:hypothetical protein
MDSPDNPSPSKLAVLRSGHGGGPLRADRPLDIGKLSAPLHPDSNQDKVHAFNPAINGRHNPPEFSP